MGRQSTETKTHTFVRHSFFFFFSKMPGKFEIQFSGGNEGPFNTQSLQQLPNHMGRSEQLQPYTFHKISSTQITELRIKTKTANGRKSL